MKTKILSGLAGLALLVSGCGDVSKGTVVWEQKGDYKVPRVERTVERVEKVSEPLIITAKRGEENYKGSRIVLYLGMQRASGTYDFAANPNSDAVIPMHFDMSEEVIEFGGCKYEPVDIQPQYIKLKVLGCK